VFCILNEGIRPYITWSYMDSCLEAWSWLGDTWPMKVFSHGVVDPVKYISWEDQWISWRHVMRGCGFNLCNYIILDPLLCMKSPWSMKCVLWSGALHLCWPTSAHCRLLVIN
jgi:hypothetical protein